MRRSHNDDKVPADRRRRRKHGKAAETPHLLNAAQDADGSLTPRPLLLGLSGKGWLIVIAFVAVVFLAYQPAWQGGFVWDDDTHLLDNPVLRPGGLLQTWIPGTYCNYWPITSSVYRLEYELWGLNPLGYHLVNIALHVLSALLVWRILEHLQIPGGLLAAAIFALHPVNVESVAWITQLKNTLSLALALLALLFYLLHERDGGRWRYALSLGLFLMSALAKGMTLTLPVILLACDWWQRGSIGRRDLLRMLPFLLIAALMVCMEVVMQHVSAGSAVVRSDGIFSRTAIAGCAVWFYFWKFIWPVNLMLVYPRWNIGERDWWAYLPGLLLVVLLALAWWKRRSWGRPVVMAILCYAALLLPALGFVNIYFMEYSLVSDHWQYAAMIVLCAAFAGAAATLVRRLPWPRAGYFFCFGLLLILAVLTFRQSRMFRNSETLYLTTIDRNPNCWLAYTNLGKLLADRGESDAAIAHYEKALKIKPDHAAAHYNLGIALADRGQADAAIAHYQKALEIDPKYAAAHINLGSALAGRGQTDAAIAHFQKALEINLNDPVTHNNLGNALAGIGQANAAAAHYQKALELNPDYAEAHVNFGVFLARCGLADSAIDHFGQALEIMPDNAVAHYNLGIALAGRGQVDSAIAHIKKALEIKPGYAAARKKLEALSNEKKKP